jgi:hypothetical protein
MASKQRLGFYFLCLILIFSFFGCATSNQRLNVLERQVAQLQDDLAMAMGTGVGAATRMYGRDCQRTTTCAKSLDSIADAVIQDGDLAIVIDSSGDLYFYRFNNSSTESENYPWIIQPNDAAGNGDWILTRSIVFKNDASADSYVRIYENYGNGQNYFEYKVPADIDTNHTFIGGGWYIHALSVTTSDITVETDDAKTLFYLTIAGLTNDREIDLPAATGSGIEYIFYILDGDVTYDLRIDPNGTDRILGVNILGTNGDGDYIWADAANERVHLVDCASGRWCTVASGGTWTYQ